MARSISPLNSAVLREEAEPAFDVVREVHDRLGVRLGEPDGGDVEGRPDEAGVDRHDLLREQRHLVVTGVLPGGVLLLADDLIQLLPAFDLGEQRGHRVVVVVDRAGELGDELHPLVVRQGDVARLGIPDGGGRLRGHALPHRLRGEGTAGRGWLRHPLGNRQPRLGACAC